MIDTSKQYIYNGKPVRIYADGSDTLYNHIHIGYFDHSVWKLASVHDSELVEVWKPKEKRISMTKEDLIKVAMIEYSCGTNVSLERIMKKFFDSNICIPKGENRHPSSDILHMAIEGVKIQGWNHIKNEWEDDTSWFIDKNDLDYPTKYRIKPSEPVYEWQWCLIYKIKSEVTSYMASNKHLTDKEAEEWIRKYVNKNYFKPIKIEETKRERK